MIKNKLYLDILDKKRKEIFQKLFKVFGDDYYLAGGTALALQIKHRESFDFDLFGNKEITFTAKRKLIKGLKGYSLQTLVDTSDELSVALDNDVKLTLLNYYWDPIFPLIKLSGIIPLLSIRDIAATKAYALGRRGSYRDYFDLYVIVKNGYSNLKQIINSCEKKYGEIFSARMFLEQLVYAGDIEADKQLKYLGEKYASPRKIIEFFKKEIKNIE